MASTWGALAQSAPAATTLTDAYTVPAGRRATLEVIITNRGAGTTVRLSHALSGATDAAKQYLLYGHTLDAGASVVTEEIRARGTDVIRVYSASGDVTFNINGIEEQG